MHNRLLLIYVSLIFHLFSLTKLSDIYTVFSLFVSCYNFIFAFVIFFPTKPFIIILRLFYDFIFNYIIDFDNIFSHSVLVNMLCLFRSTWGLFLCFNSNNKFKHILYDSLFWLIFARTSSSQHLTACCEIPWATPLSW